MTRTLRAAALVAAVALSGGCSEPGLYPTNPDFVGASGSVWYVTDYLMQGEPAMWRQLDEPEVIAIPAADAAEWIAEVGVSYEQGDTNIYAEPGETDAPPASATVATADRQGAFSWDVPPGRYLVCLHHAARGDTVLLCGSTWLDGGHVTVVENPWGLGFGSLDDITESAVYPAGR